MKTGLVMEGGAMRGMFTAGILDVFMENGIAFEGAVGVSAGAVFGCNYKSKQPGRAIRYNKKYCNDPRYASFRSLIRTGNLYNEQFCYHEIPDVLDKFDTKTFTENPMEFYVVCTDVETGKPVYHLCKDGGYDDIEWMRASASMPLASKLIEIDGRYFSDGGSADSIPIRFFEKIGYEKNVVILTQPKGFVKTKNQLLPIMHIALRKYPNFLHTLATRHIVYNETLSYVETQRRKGKVFVIQPPQPLNIGSVEHNPDELERVYQIGRSEAEKSLDKVNEFLNG
jgi:predicted patatin/cPLA2 family phospholipase